MNSGGGGKTECFGYRKFSGFLFCKMRDPQNSPLEKNGFALGIGSFLEFYWNFGGFSSFGVQSIFTPSRFDFTYLTRVCFSTGWKLVNQYNQISFVFFLNAHQLGSEKTLVLCC